MKRAAALDQFRSSPRRGLLNRVAAAKAAKEEIGSPRADRPTPTKPKVEPNLKRQSSGSKLGSDACTPVKRAPGQGKGKSDRDEDDEELLDCLFDEEGDCELVGDDAEAEKNVCLACFRVTNVDEHHLVPGVAMPLLHDRSRGSCLQGLLRNIQGLAERHHGAGALRPLAEGQSTHVLVQAHRIPQPETRRTQPRCEVRRRAAGEGDPLRIQRGGYALSSALRGPVRLCQVQARG